MATEEAKKPNPPLPKQPRESEFDAFEESTLDSDLEGKLQIQLEQKIQSLSGIRYLILRHVMEGEYKRSKEELKKYAEMKQQYTRFLIRTEPYIKHSIDIINTIETKRKFINIKGMINRSRQKEMFSSILEHFDELKSFMNKTAEIAKEEELNDLKSTVFVIKILFLCLFTLFVISFLVLESISMLKSFYVIIDAFVNDLLGKLFSYLDLLP